MSKIDVVRAWKDAGYRAGLSAAERAALPTNPAGMVDLSDLQQESVNGGATEFVLTQIAGCFSCFYTCNRMHCDIVYTGRTVCGG